MKLSEFERTVLKLVNHTYIRSYYYINFPLAPQQMGIGFPFLEEAELWEKELLRLGFTRGQYSQGIFVIERTPDTGSCPCELMNKEKDQ